jgi:hypothetical protein
MASMSGRRPRQNAAIRADEVVDSEEAGSPD